MSESTTSLCLIFFFSSPSPHDTPACSRIAASTGIRARLEARKSAATHPATYSVCNEIWWATIGLRFFIWGHFGARFGLTSSAQVIFVTSRIIAGSAICAFFGRSATSCRYRCLNRCKQVPDSLLQATGYRLQILHIVDIAADFVSHAFWCIRSCGSDLSDKPPLRL